MTGEMAWIKQNGEDSNGEEWAVHAAVARAVGGRLEPFDVYQGPYIVVGPDSRVGERPYQLNLPGPLRLWLQMIDDGFGCIYREDTEAQSPPFPVFGSDAESLAVEAARKLLSISDA